MMYKFNITVFYADEDFWQSAALDELKSDKANLQKDVRNGEKKLLVGS
jgi:hypothetical protein